MTWKYRYMYPLRVNIWTSIDRVSWVLWPSPIAPLSLKTIMSWKKIEQNMTNISEVINIYKMIKYKLCILWLYQDMQDVWFLWSFVGCFGVDFWKLIRHVFILPYSWDHTLEPRGRGKKCSPSYRRWERHRKIRNKLAFFQ